jgi:hypothetical protein
MKKSLLHCFLFSIFMLGLTSCGDNNSGASGIGNPQVEVAVAMDFSNPNLSRSMVESQINAITDSSRESWQIDSISIRTDRIDLNSNRIADGIYTAELMSAKWHPVLPKREVPKGQYSFVQLNLSPEQSAQGKSSFIIYGKNLNTQEIVHVKLFWNEELIFRSKNEIDLQSGNHQLKLMFNAYTWFQNISIRNVAKKEGSSLILDETLERDARWATDIRERIRTSLSMLNQLK